MTSGVFSEAVVDRPRASSRPTGNFHERSLSRSPCLHHKHRLRHSCAAHSVPTSAGEKSSSYMIGDCATPLSSISVEAGDEFDGMVVDALRAGVTRAPFRQTAPRASPPPRPSSRWCR